MHRYAALHISVSLMNFQLGINSRFNDMVLTYAPKLWIRDLTKGWSNHKTSLIAHSSSFVSSCQELVSQILICVHFVFHRSSLFPHHKWNEHYDTSYLDYPNTHCIHANFHWTNYCTRRSVWISCKKLTASRYK